MGVRICAVAVAVALVSSLTAHPAMAETRLPIRTGVKRSLAELRDMAPASVALQQAATPAQGSGERSGGLSKGAKIGLAVGVIGGAIAVGFAAGKGPDPRKWP